MLACAHPTVVIWKVPAGGANGFSRSDTRGPWPTTFAPWPGLAFLVAAVAALGSLFSYEFLRAIADRLAPDGNAANLDLALHAAIVVNLRAIAVSAAIAAGSLLVGGQAVASRLATPRFRRAPTLVWTVVFVIVLLGVRLWYLDFEGWDESTFIIMGSHVLEGHLPYLELFDIKPPGIFFALAGVMSVFGENLLAVRFFGTFCLLVSAIAGYAIAIRQTTPLIAGASMTVFCALTCADEFQPTMTEHLTITLMMPACWLLVARRDQLWVAFLVGVLLSAATLTRMNIAFVVLAVGGFYVWRFVRPRPDVPRLADRRIWRRRRPATGAPAAGLLARGRSGRFRTVRLSRAVSLRLFPKRNGGGHS